jgi:short-subunit dehydrogenase
VDIYRDAEVRKSVAGYGKNSHELTFWYTAQGRSFHGEWESISLADLDLLYKTNLRPRFCWSERLCPRSGQQGQIVFINSSAGRSARAKTGAYSATKYGLCAFADSLREEVNPAGIRVISAYPGRTATPMQELVCRLEGSEFSAERFLNPCDVAAAVIHGIGLNQDTELTDLYIRPMRKPK